MEEETFVVKSAVRFMISCFGIRMIENKKLLQFIMYVDALRESNTIMHMLARGDQ